MKKGEEAVKQATAADIARGKAVESEEKAKAEKKNAELQTEVAKKQTDLAEKAKIKADQATEAQAYESYIAQIGLAAAQIDQNAFDSARQILESLSDNASTNQHLNWEWGRLMYLCTRGFTFEAPKPQPVVAVAVSRDGRTFVSGGEQGSAAIWPMSTDLDEKDKVKLVPLHTLELPGRVNVLAAAYSPDDKFVVLGTDDSRGYIKVFDAATGEPIARTFEAKMLDGQSTSVEQPRPFDLRHTSEVLSVKFSRDAKWLLTSSADQTARLWDFASGRQITRLHGHDGDVLAVDFGELTVLWGDEPNQRATIPDGRILTAGQYGRALLWELFEYDDAAKQVRPVWELTDEMSGEPRVPKPGFPFTGHKGPIFAAAFSPKGEFVVTAGYDTRVLVWRPTDVKAFNFRALAPELNADTAENAAAGADKNTAKSSDAQNDRVVPIAKTVAEYRGHTAIIRSVAFSADGKLIASCGHDNTVRLWGFDPEADEQITDAAKVFKGHGSWVRACRFAPDAKWILSASLDGKIKKWNIEDYAESRILSGKKLSGHGDAVMSVSFSPIANSHQAVTSSRDRTARTWDLEKTQEKKTFRAGHLFLTSRALFSSDGRRLFTAAADNSLRMWDVATGGELTKLDKTGRATVMALSHNPVKLQKNGNEYAADILLTGDGRVDDENKPVDEQQARNEVRVWEVTVGGVTPLMDLKGVRNEITALAFSHDDSIVLAGDSQGHCYLWNRESGELIKRVKRHEFRVTAVAFLPGNEEVLSASQDNVVSCWNVESGKEIQANVLSHPASVHDMAVSKDGQQVLTACADGVVRLWHRNRLDENGKPTFTALFTVVPDPNLPVKQQREQVLEESIDSVAVSSDFRRAVLISSSTRPRTDRSKTRLQFWDLEKRKQIPLPDSFTKVATGIRSFGNGGGTLRSAAFAPNDRQFVTVGGEDGHLWDYSTGDLQMHFSPHGVVASAVYSSNGKWILTSSWDKSARIWVADPADPDSQRALLQFDGQHRGRVNTAVFKPTPSDPMATPEFVMTASDDGTVMVWKILNEAAVANAQAGPVDKTLSRKVEFSLKHRRKLDDDTIELSPVHSAVFTKDGKFILTAADDNNARIWNSSGNQDEPLWVLAHDGPVLSVASSSSKQDGFLWIATGCRDSTGRIYRVSFKADGSIESVDHMLTMKGHTASVTSVAFSEDGKRVLTASEDNTIKLWDTAVRETTQDVNVPEPKPAVEAVKAVEAGGKQTFDVFLQAAQPANPANAVPQDGAAKGNGQKKPGPPLAKEILTLSGHSREVTSVAVSPDGLQVLTASQDGRAILWLTIDWRTDAKKE
ncbi:MAG: hypothetical protein O3A00_06805 [Planctomycetota bacterium]|nr:hypothetical protein [Planctomycetota bacterium]